jgi:hypothetical protein
MAKAYFYETPGRANEARRRAPLVAAGREHALRALLKGGWTAATSQHFFGVRPAAPEQRHGAFADPPAPQLPLLLKDRMFHVMTSRRTSTGDFE